MIDRNSIFDDLPLSRCYMTYSYPEVANKNEGGIQLRDKLISSIAQNVVGKDISDFNIINTALY